ncbi:hypothetical protein JCM24511_01039 [Saitozyma sp. JCM 24511]|nr:hypothetical protein JCM24511_01039 [Saitozyma sp. JCM 24511]
MAKPYTPGKSGRFADLFMDSTKPVTEIQDEWCRYSLTLLDASVNELDELTIEYNTAESYPWKGRGPRNQWVHQDYRDSAAVDSWLDDHPKVEKDMKEKADFSNAVWFSATGTQMGEDQQVEGNSVPYARTSDSFTCTWTSNSGGEGPALVCTLKVRSTSSLRGTENQVSERVSETRGERDGGSSESDAETDTTDESSEEGSEESMEDGESAEESAEESDGGAEE